MAIMEESGVADGNAVQNASDHFSAENFGRGEEEGVGDVEASEGESVDNGHEEVVDDASVADASADTGAPAEQAPRARNLADLLKNQKRLQQEREELAHNQRQLASYIDNLRASMSDPERAPEVLRAMGIDVDQVVANVARERLGIEVETKEATRGDQALVRKIGDLEQKIQQLVSHGQESSLRRSAERQVSAVLATNTTDLPYLSEAIRQDPDLVDKIADVIVQRQRAGKDVDVLEIIKESEEITEGNIRNTSFWMLKSPKLRQELRNMLDEYEGRPAPTQPRKGSVKVPSKDDKVSIASREPAGQAEFLSDEDLDRQMLEEIISGQK